ncbi:class I SAM-dependent DNA methyltransferase [Tepidamorphus sp. 3E244]|uniref:class I SAM-dependent DNA methyltransferase n=1 Tax=Tepidamorphus sp. 3E244 TaxID=3385498 RepID=UPI0038FC29A8
MTRDAASFDRLYRENPDPWDYETSAYEADKYARCLSLLPRARYGRVLEVGCSIGVMSAQIARRSDALLGLDFAPTAIEVARARHIPNARFEVAAVPQDWPSGQWDLIVLSEVLYYLEDDALARTIACVGRDLAPDGDCLVAGYTGETETRLTARDVETRLVGALSETRPNHSIKRCEGDTWIAALFSSRPAHSTGADSGRYR